MDSTTPTVPAQKSASKRERSCPVCGRPFRSTNGSQYCSRTCRDRKNYLIARSKAVRMKEHSAEPCLVCGGVVKQRKGAGRLARFCCDECRDLSHLLTRVAAHVSRVAIRSTPEARAYLRMQLWSIANTTSASDRLSRKRKPERLPSWREGLEPTRP